MQCDGFTLSKIVKELKNTITLGKVNKITQHERDEILISVYSQKDTVKLLISCNPENPRIHITAHNFDNPMTPPSFCMTLRKHLVGYKIVEIEQENMDRVVKITFEGLNDLQDTEHKFLYVEIMGKHSNIILTSESDTILCASKTTFLDSETSRKIIAGIKYEPAKTQDKFFILDKNNIEKKLLNSEDKTENILQKNIYGISQILAKEITIQADGSVNKVMDKLQEFYNKEPMPMISEKYFLPFQYSTIQGDFKSISTMNEALDEFYFESAKKQRFLSKAKSLISALRAAISRTEKKLARTQDNIHKSRDFEKFKLFGELITANIYKIKIGDKQLHAQNYYDENLETVKIELDETLSPARNAQKYYKKYTKNKKTFEMNSEALEKIEEQISYLKSIEQSFDFCGSVSELNDIRGELEAAGIVKETKSKVKNTNIKTSSPIETEFGGYKIIIGKNNLQNENVTKNARPNDMWLHVLKEHGSHVIIKNPSECEIPSEVIEFAAKKAKEYSAAKNGGKTCVDYTLKKFVKKPPKSNLGIVTYTNQKTCMVE